MFEILGGFLVKFIPAESLNNAIVASGGDMPTVRGSSLAKFASPHCLAAAISSIIACTDTFNGHTIHTVLSDFQGRTNGGSGFLRMLEFSPSNNVIHVRTYSPWLDQVEIDADSQFDIPYGMTSAPTPTPSGRWCSGRTSTTPNESPSI